MMTDNPLERAALALVRKNGRFTVPDGASDGLRKGLEDLAARNVLGRTDEPGVYRYLKGVDDLVTVLHDRGPQSRDALCADGFRTVVMTDAVDQGAVVLDPENGLYGNA